MTDKIKAYFESIKGKRVAFCGIGVSHIPLIKKYAEAGAVVTACDRRNEADFPELAAEFKALGVTLSLGDGYLSCLDSQDIIFRTPGMVFDLPELQEAREQGITITSEMETFFDLCPAKIFAVTGSDGKTTTTSVIAEILKADGKTVHLGGNIGRPLLPEIETVSPDDFAVVELSSFQLITMTQSPDVAVITNITPNHLNVHKDMAEYVDAKRNIFIRQKSSSRTVVNLDNDITRSFLPEINGEALAFSRTQTVENGAYFKDGVVYIAKDGVSTPIMKREDIRLPGMHNVENYLAAIAAVWGFVDPSSILDVARTFGGVEHRIELVRELNGVKWYNDSIATSPTRTIAGLRSFEQKLIIIAGGYDKHIPFEPMVPDVLERVKALILTGHTADKIEAAVTQSPDYPDSDLKIYRAADIPEAVKIANEIAERGDIVSLSPACASFDAYPNFEARGRHFKQLVNEL